MDTRPVMELQEVLISAIEDVPAPESKARQLSLMELGLVEPVKLRINGAGGYEIVKGRRRIADLKALGVENVLALVEEMDAIQAAQESLTDICRSSNYMSEAEDIAKLEEAGYTQLQIAKMMGVSQPVISQRSRLLDLIPELQDKLKTGQMTFSCARIAVKLPVEDQIKLAHMDKPTVQAAKDLLAEYQSDFIDLSDLDIPDVPEDYAPPVVIPAEDMERLMDGEAVIVEWMGHTLTVSVAELITA